MVARRTDDGCLLPQRALSREAGRESHAWLAGDSVKTGQCVSANSGAGPCAGYDSKASSFRSLARQRWSFSSRCRLGVIMSAVSKRNFAAVLSLLTSLC